MEASRYKKYLKVLSEGLVGYVPTTPKDSIESYMRLGIEVDTLDRAVRDKGYKKVKVSESALNKEVYVSRETEYLDKVVGLPVTYSKKQAKQIIKTVAQVEKNKKEVLKNYIKKKLGIMI